MVQILLKLLNAIPAYYNEKVKPLTRATQVSLKIKTHALHLLMHSDPSIQDKGIGLSLKTKVEVTIIILETGINVIKSKRVYM
jgi:hypothetical protein